MRDDDWQDNHGKSKSPVKTKRTEITIKIGKRVIYILNTSTHFFFGNVTQKTNELNA